MNRKQHIETLKRFTDSNPKGKCYTHEQLMEATQYAIDHLSREWVSRKTHRKLIKELNKKIEEVSSLSERRNDFINMKQKEIDHLKIDKDRLQKQFDCAIKQRDEHLITIRQLYDQNAYLTATRDSARREVAKLKNKIIWISITTAILFIVLIISLLN